MMYICTSVLRFASANICIMLCTLPRSELRANFLSFEGSYNLPSCSWLNYSSYIIKSMFSYVCYYPLKSSDEFCLLLWGFWLLRWCYHPSTLTYVKNLRECFNWLAWVSVTPVSVVTARYCISEGLIAELSQRRIISEFEVCNKSGLCDVTVATNVSQSCGTQI